MKAEKSQKLLTLDLALTPFLMYPRIFSKGWSLKQANHKKQIMIFFVFHPLILHPCFPHFF